jgi:hypothetical protein
MFHIVIFYNIRYILLLDGPVKNLNRPRSGAGEAAWPLHPTDLDT